MNYVPPEISEYLNAPIGTKNHKVALAELFGTEHFCGFLYSYCRMTHPRTVVELGTGAGVCAIMIGLALKHNRKGRLFTLDDGRGWPDIRTAVQKALNYKAPNETFTSFANTLVSRFGLKKQVSFIKQDVNKKRFAADSDIDLLFCDAMPSDINGCIKYLSDYLPQMAQYSSIFIDRASTLIPSHLFLESFVEQLNKEKLPLSFAQNLNKAALSKMNVLLRKCRFQLVPLNECSESKVNKNQNSRAWIRIEPADYVHHNRVDNMLSW